MSLPPCSQEASALEELLLVIIALVLLPTSIAATAAMPSVREIVGQRRDA